MFSPIKRNSISGSSGEGPAPLEAKVMLASNLSNTWKYTGKAPGAVKSRARKAGRKGGIGKAKSKKTITVKPSKNARAAIQNAINKLGKSGGTVKLTRGTFGISGTVLVRSGVVLKGSGNGTVLNITMRHRSAKGRKVGIALTGSNGGLESMVIKSSQGGRPNRSKYDNVSKSNYVGGVLISGNQNWVKGIFTKNTGSNPITITGNNNTVLNSNFHGAWNKGTGGHGYVAIIGGNNLFAGNDVKEIRHLALQTSKSKGNVIAQNKIGTDVNWHNGDGGFNLVANNRFTTPGSHLWGQLHTGERRFGHKPPGKHNYLVNNKGSGEIRSGTWRVTGQSSNKKGDISWLKKV